MMQLVVIAVACLLLLLPLKAEKWRKCRPLIAVLALSFMLSLLVPGLNDTVQVRIRALGQANEASQGEEVRITSIKFDGIEQDLSTLFQGNKWTIVDNALVWRSLNEQAEPTMYGQWPHASVYEITFQKNKSRGMAEVEMGGREYVIDCYDATEQGVSGTVTFKGIAKMSFLRKMLSFIIMVATLVLICIMLPLFFRSSIQSETRIPPPVTRESWSDALRLLAIFTIVLVSSSGGAFETMGLSGAGVNVIEMIIYALQSFAFPAFVMLTGAFLLHRDEEPRATLIRRLPSVLIPLVSMLAIYAVISGFGGDENSPTFAYVVETLFDTTNAVPWFFVILVMLYLLTPMLRLIFVNAEKQVGTYAVTILYILPSFVYTVVELTGVTGALLTVVGGIACVGQFIFGAHLASMKDKVEGKWIKPAIIMLLGALATILVRYYVCVNVAKPMVTPLMGGLESLLFCGGMFALFMSLSPQFAQLPEKLRVVIKHISSLGIGTLVIFTVLIRKFPSISLGQFRLNANSTMLHQGLLIGVIYFILSLAISYIIGTIPIFRRVIGLDWYTANDKKK